MGFLLGCRKYEEISPPHVEDFCYITDNTYTKQEVIFPVSALLYVTSVASVEILRVTLLYLYLTVGGEDGE